ncbi:MAG: primosomal protein N' [Deltaproteobacteria bacterium]|nr:primosomal protein N' [Deltaproteobacteria bacterium]
MPTGQKTYIDVAVAVPVYKTYTYAVSEPLSSMIAIGKRVLVPFKSRKVTGYILGGSQPGNKFKTKLILDVLDHEPLFPESMVKFFKWIADYYIHPIGEIIQGALPSGINIFDFSVVSATQKGNEAVRKNTESGLRLDVLNCLGSSALARKDISRRIKKDISNALLKQMEGKGLLEIRQVMGKSRTRTKIESYLSVLNPDIPKDRFFNQRKQIINLILLEKEIPKKQLLSLMPKAKGLLNYLEANRHIAITKKSVFRDPFGEDIQPDVPPRLTEEQGVAVEAVVETLGNGFKSFLLKGVTGSGKTEVYMHASQEAINLGFSVIVLVPEISLISQTERRFRARFGQHIAVLHSGLSSGEKYDQWLKIRNDDVQIVIGARSAIFAPLKNPGIIIVDEEHDSSYKQETGLRYNARDLAVVRAKQLGAVVLLGSATPSIQSLHNALQNKFTALELKNRVNRRPLPEISIVDLGEYRDATGINHFITPILHDAIKEALERKEQVLLFLNRRGFASFPVCACCGESVRCKNCDITLTFHKGINAFKCHLCGYTKAAVSECTNCGSPSIKTLGMGTEKIEAGVKKLFPEAKIARLDRDTTTRKGSLLKILKGIRNHDTDILIGTQMVAKGHDFPNITLVGIICADLSLSFPDFRASEHTFQLLAQVAGRAGRGDRKGHVIMQTYNPSHLCISNARNQDCDGYFHHETGFRKALGYPPFSRLAQLKISGKDRMLTKTHALKTGNVCRQMLQEGAYCRKNLEMLGPVESPVAKIAGRYRWQILLKCSESETLHSFIRSLMFENRSLMIQTRKVRVSINIDPVFMM